MKVNLPFGHLADIYIFRLQLYLHQVYIHLPDNQVANKTVGTLITRHIQNQRLFNGMI